MKYLIVIAIFLSLTVLFTSIVGASFVANNLFYCCIGFYVVLEIVDVLINHSLKVKY